MRWYSTGDVRADEPLKRYTPGGPLVQFDRYVDREGPIPDFRPDLGPCWIWSGCVKKNGYGYLTINGKEALAHRWAYNEFVKPVHPRLAIDHLCRVTACVNYESHLEQVTHRTNIRRGFSDPANYARRDSCHRGHEYTPENLIIRPDKSRGCRACDKERQHGYYLNRKARRAKIY